MAAAEFDAFVGCAFEGLKVLLKVGGMGDRCVVEFHGVSVLFLLGSICDRMMTL